MYIDFFLISLRKQDIFCACVCIFIFILKKAIACTQLDNSGISRNTY